MCDKNHSRFFIRLRHWEYWPFLLVYFPVIFVWFWYCLRARSFFFFSASNPSIKYGGYTMEPKDDIYKLIPIEYYPKTLSIQPQESYKSILQKIQEKEINFPCIIKPNIGMKGMGVMKIDNTIALEKAVALYTVPFLIQELINYPLEVGVFYIRNPHENKGRITGIVWKEMLAVIGDGIHTIEALILREPRYVLQIDAIKKLFTPTALQEILAKDISKVLVPFGNHARGALFLDYTNKYAFDWEGTINKACIPIKDFYYGRLDIKFNSVEELAAGKKFSIIEINGAGSEPTHIYDPSHHIFFAWKEIIKHWEWMYQIAKYNHRKGLPYLSFKEGLHMYMSYFSYIKELKSLIAKQ